MKNLSDLRIGKNPIPFQTIKSFQQKASFQVSNI